MKKLIFLLLTLTAPATRAQQPIPRITEVCQTHDWYVGQIDAWRPVAERAPTDAAAWFEYYKAVRYAGKTGADTAVRNRYHAEGERLLARMAENLSNTFEYHYAKWWTGGNDRKFFPHLEAAYRLRPDDPYFASDLIAYYELEYDREKVAFFSKKWYDTHAMPPALLEYNYNVLASLAPNTVLITGGDNDTYPVWLLQYARNVRPDVLLLKLSLMSEPEYHGKVLDAERLVEDRAAVAPARIPELGWRGWAQALVQALGRNKLNRPVYCALTLSPELVDGVKDKLYLTGLAHRYSETRFDNIAKLKSNWKKFRLEADELPADDALEVSLFDRT